MKKIDIILALVTGGTLAWFFSGIAKDIKFLASIPSLSLILFVLMPILSVFGLWIAWLLGKKFLFIFQVAKFVLLGAMATLIDLGAFKALGLALALNLSFANNIYKAISFLVATFVKYWGNKFWAFEKMEKKGMGKEMLRFYIVTALGLAVDVGIFSVVVNNIGPQFGIPLKTWETVGVLAAAVIVSVWNFIGYKFIVFKK
ncbi:MAG: GtrA family protein [bacterium]|nr:GtrA family protein [bacterium]